MKVKVERATRCVIYVPTSTNPDAVESVCNALAGGYTKYPNAWGEWFSGMAPVSESVCVYECVTTTNFSQVLQQLELAGKRFLSENPGEVCFMAYVSGRRITIFQKDYE